MDKKYTYEDFLGIMRTLLGEGGCPWDREQTHESLRQYVLEEAYEAVEAINNNDMANLCEELGDLLLQIVFHAEIERKKGSIYMDDVVDGISRKMIKRHSHIFGADHADTPDEVKVTWEANKKAEKGYKTQTDVLRGVAKSLPALTRAVKVAGKADDGVFEEVKADKAVCDLKAEVEDVDLYLDDIEKMEDKIGEILLKTTILSAIFKINPEFALTKSIEKFINRFERYEAGR